jgi:hypothetical protein
LGCQALLPLVLDFQSLFDELALPWFVAQIKAHQLSNGQKLQRSLPQLHRQGELQTYYQSGPT